MMATSSDDGFDDNELQDDVDIDGDMDADGDADGDLEEELMEELNEELGSDEDSSSDSDDEEDADGDEEQAPRPSPPLLLPMDVDPRPTASHLQVNHDMDTAPSPPRARRRSNSPSTARRRTIIFPLGPNAPLFKSCVVEAVAALPHPAPIHCLASSACMSHLITGADDGYVRDYDIFPSLNGKNHLTAPQRHHAGVVEGVLKAVQIRYWWENPMVQKPAGSEEGQALSPVYALAMQSDALWALAGNDTGSINLFTVRHEPGRLCHTMQAGRNTITALALDHDEKAFFSAGGDGDAILWDLNTGQRARVFSGYGPELTSIAVRPMNFLHLAASSDAKSETTKPPQNSAVVPPPNGDADGGGSDDGSFDDLFDEPDPSQKPVRQPAFSMSLPSSGAQNNLRPGLGTISANKNAPPVLDSTLYTQFSPDLLLTAAIDGQVVLWDKRVNTPGTGVGRLWMGEKTPPWCISACWSPDGGRIFAGRRNGAIDVYDVRQLGRVGPSGTPSLLKVLKNPASSGVVSCVVAFPDNKHIACASIDNLRLWNVDAVDTDIRKPKSGAQFKIIPGHHGGHISSLLVDSGCRFLVSASSNRGWPYGDSTKTVFVHDIKHVL